MIIVSIKDIRNLILSRRNRVYQYDEREENNGHIKLLDISTLSNEELKTIIFHHSLKKYKNAIDREGVKTRIGMNSEGIDYLEAIYFSYGIEAVLQTWDVWLKWRANRLGDPYFQEEYKELIAAIRNGTATEQEKKEFWYKCKLWNDEFLSGEYKRDKEKMNFLFEFQIDEMIASNYYVLDLVEGKDFSFDEIDVKKDRELKKDKNSLSYRKFIEINGGHSNMETPLVDKWNMNTFLGKKIIINPDRVKQLTVPNGKNDVLSVVLFLYDKYKEITQDEQQVHFDVLDEYIEYVKEKIKNNQLQKFDGNTRINQIEKTSFFHDQKSDTYFRDVYSELGEHDLNDGR